MHSMITFDGSSCGEWQQIRVIWILGALTLFAATLTCLTGSGRDLGSFTGRPIFAAGGAYNHTVSPCSRKALPAAHVRFMR